MTLERRLRAGSGIGVQFTTFAGVGAISTGVHYVVLVALVELFTVAAWVGSASGAFAGAVTSYVLNRRITFRSNVAHAQSLPRFAVVAGSGLGLNTAIVAGLVAIHLHYLLAQVAATLIVLVWNFVLNRQWTFKAKV